MNAQARLQPLSEPCDAEDAIAILQTLTDGLFLIDLRTRLCRPVNAAAKGMLADTPNHLSAELPLEQCFPELDFSSPHAIVATSHLAHFSTGSGIPCDVHVQFRRLVASGLSTENETQLLAIVRKVGVKASADGFSPRDAFDDAFHDPLTRLPNHRLFARRLERAVRRGMESNYRYAVLFVDLDRFKAVNDQFGHLIGDRLLISAAHRLVEAVRPQDMVARRSGDEFTILLDDLDQPEHATQVAERIVEHFNLPFLVEGPDHLVEAVLGTSIGIALPGGTTTTSEDLMVLADKAMYQAKALGRGTFATLSTVGNRPKPR